MTLYSLLYKSAKCSLNFAFKFSFLFFSCVYLCTDCVSGLLSECKCLFRPAKRFQVKGCVFKRRWWIFKNPPKLKFSRKAMNFSCLICALNLYFTHLMCSKRQNLLKFARTPKSCSQRCKLSCLKLADNNLEKPTILLVWVDFHRH